MGCTNKEISERTGLSSQRLSIVLNAPQVSNEVERTRRHVFERDAEAAMRTMLPKALESIDKVLSFDTQNFREMRDKASTGFTLIEHTHGKPTQRIEASGSLLSDLFKLMDERSLEDAKRAGVVDAEFSEIHGSPRADIDPLDEFLKKESGREDEI